MEFKALIVNIEDNIATVTVNRPKALNAINKDVMEELGYLFMDGGLPADDLFGVVITGAGEKAFAAGADITEFMSLSPEEGSALSRKGHNVFNAIENFSLPVIAAINGFSLGGGNELAMACHIRIASNNARFGQPEVNLGLIPGYGATQRLVQYLGKGRAMELLLTADMIDAETALNYGLVTHVTEPEALLPTAYKLLGKISKKGPLAIRQTIQTVNAFFDKSTNGFEMEIDQFGKLLNSEECHEGVAAFLEKRKAAFRK
ncbi:MAG: enoyl-CoA hydratase [Saprospiraceae bacterium]|nr:enoyl-CoA hydratase [Saprospiraceae bacterium]